jgi:hypothetical protein
MTPSSPSVRSGRRASMAYAAVATLALVLSMTASPLGPAHAAAQDLSGRYLYDSPHGPVTLVLDQDAQGRMVGRLDAADGGVLQLKGVVQGGRATGQISTGGGTGWFAAGFDGPGFVLLVAEIDPATGQPDLSQSWSLQFTREPAARPPSAPPVAAAPQPASTATDQPDPFGRPDESRLAREWRGMLRGAKLTRIESYRSPTTGGGGYSDHWEAFLCSDGTLHFRDNSFTTFGDVGGYRARQGNGAGRWQVITQGDRSFLASQFEGQPVQYGELTFDPRQRATYLDGKRFYITRNDNDVCP